MKLDNISNTVTHHFIVVSVCPFERSLFVEFSLNWPEYEN